MFEVVNSGAMNKAEVMEEDFETAGALCLEYRSGLRTADTLHAAIARKPGFKLLTADPGLHQDYRHHRIANELVLFSDPPKPNHP
ncbi:MAG TPA: hypothetical protein DDY54_04875 [Deltaproteobacteria bacterium]|nr:hypothetical protein [Deltaproteobacteria bacterium]